MLEPRPRNSGDGRKLYWLCRCDCGTLREVASWDLRSGDSHSCGCLQAIEASTRMKRVHRIGGMRTTDAAINHLWVRYHKSPTAHRLGWELTREEFRKLVKGNCIFCGAAPSRSEFRGARQLSAEVFNGIDREDSSLGYVSNNCNSCCTRCNLMKLDMSRTDFLKQIEKIYEEKHS